MIINKPNKDVKENNTTKIILTIFLYVLILAAATLGDTVFTIIVAIIFGGVIIGIWTGTNYFNE